MSKAAPIATTGALRYLAPLLTFVALIAILAVSNRDESPDPVASLGPAVESEPAAATAESIARLESAVRAEPAAGTYASLGDTYLQAARDTADSAYLERAEGAFAAALGRDPQNVLATIGQGTVALAGHEFARGLELGREAQRLEPALVRPYAIIVDANVELGRYGAAAKALERMVALKPTLASYSRVSYFRELNGDLDGAVQAMRLAVAAGGGGVEGTVFAQSLLGKLELLRGHVTPAERSFEGALAIDPSYGPALAGMAGVAAMRGDEAAAIAGYRSAVAELPNAENATLLADALAAAGRNAAAERAYQRAIEIARGDPVAVNQELVLLEADHGSPAKALAGAREAWRLAPGAKSAEALAWALHTVGRSGAAYPLARRAVELHRGDPAVLYRAAQVAAGAAETAQARGWLREALAVNPRFSPVDAPRARQLLADLR
jgi:tetratricopeptide (TPR) repeat protein